MNNNSADDRSLSSRILELECERDELRKDIEQLCLHQSGPGFLTVATQMHLQRIAGLEQEIDNYKKKFALCTRNNQNLQEELSETYRIKGQLAELYRVEATKNMELEKQVKFFQGCIAAAFSERDHALMESEKAKEHEEAISKGLTESLKRAEELESTCSELWRNNAALQLELLNLKDKLLPFEQVVSKLYDVRLKGTGAYESATVEEKCFCLLNDPADMWVFDEDRRSSTMKYIVSLEEKLQMMRISMNNLQSKMQMGLEIEQHLKRKVLTLEKKLFASDDVIRNALSDLRNFLVQKRLEIMEMLDEENDLMKSTFEEIQNKMHDSAMNTDSSVEIIQKNLVCDVECRDLHITSDTDYGEIAKMTPLATTAVSTTETAVALSLALKEKVAALLLLSQQEERHLLERDLHIALQKKMEELQRNMIQVTNEKVEALLELAQLKNQFQLLLENCRCGMKHSNILCTDGGEGISSQLRDRKFRGLFKKTYLGRWMGKASTVSDTYMKSKEIASVKETDNFLAESSRLKTESTMLQESIASLRHLTSSIHKLHLSLLKARNSVTSAGSSGDVTEPVDQIIVEANQLKTSLGDLPVSWFEEESDAETKETNSDQGCHLSQNGKLNTISAAASLMLELLLVAVELQKEKCTSEKLYFQH